MTGTTRRVRRVAALTSALLVAALLETVVIHAGPAGAKPPAPPLAAASYTANLSNGPVPLGGTGIKLSSRWAKGPQLRVEVVDTATKARLHLSGLVLKVARADRGKTPAPLSVTIPNSVLNRYGSADYASRLRWNVLSGCSTTRCARTTLAPSAAAGQSVQRVTLPGVSSNAVVVAATSTATASNGTGTFAATSLSPSSQWQASPQTGDFTWSYPLRVPPPVAGPAPNLALSYDSGSVDGETASTNNQPSGIGDGWDLSGLGYIERSYATCKDDGAGEMYDLCWKSDNATMYFGGHSGRLIQASDGTWHLQNDDGSKIQKVVGGNGNGLYHGEYWRMTDRDGTRYYFGVNQLPGWTSSTPDSANTNSAWAVPVAGNNTNEPCHKDDTLADNFCPNMGWRWNLDYVVDAHGNAMAIHYAPETAHYAEAGAKTGGASFTAYTRGGTVSEIDYGMRDGSAYTTHPQSVVFTVADRCVTTTNCDHLHTTNWPDSAMDTWCVASPCAVTSPTFWSQKKITSIQTRYLQGASNINVDQYTLSQSFTDPQDGSRGALWLDKIAHTGQVGGTASMPNVNFGGALYQNRVVPTADGLVPFMKQRVTTIHLDTGGYIYIGYLASDCDTTHLPASAETDTMRCFQQHWTPDGGTAADERTEYFNKYPVASVSQDGYTGGPGQADDQTYYDYSQATPIWKLDVSPVTKDTKRTWDVFAGFNKVRVKHGDTNTPSQQVVTDYTYFRGLDGETSDVYGHQRSVTLTASDGTQATDSPQFAGQPFETITRNGPSGPVVTDEINQPWLSPATAIVADPQQFTGYPIFTVTNSARMTSAGTTRDRTALSAGGYRTAEVVTGHDSLGRVISVNDRGDVATPDDDRCTTTSYADNTTAWLLNAPAEVKTVGKDCGGTPTYPADAVSDTRNYYDGSATLGAMPGPGDVTRTDVVKDYDSNHNPVWLTTATNTYDGLGRQLSSKDELNRPTSTAYTPAFNPASPGTNLGGLTQTVTTNPVGWTQTTGYNRAWRAETFAVDANGHRTDANYDPLGRRTQVWLPDRQPTSSFATPSISYTYMVSNSAANSVGTTTLTSTGGTVTSYTLYDGLMRPRQTQAPSEATGAAAVITDTLYDHAGRVSYVDGPYGGNAYPSATLWDPGVRTNIPGTVRTDYDAAGRVSATVQLAHSVEQWRTSYTYGGDHVDTTPPAGGQASTTFTDVRGNTTKLLAYHGGSPTGAADATSYGYDHAGRMTSMTDAAGSHWSWSFDVLGRQTGATDPDAGTTHSHYDDAGRLTSTTKANGDTLAYVYDTLDRKTEEHEDTAAGPLLANWTYDTLPDGTVDKGQPVASVAHVDGGTYSTTVTGYDVNDRPTGTRTTITAPTGAGPGQAAATGSWDTGVVYNPDGSNNNQTLPAVGGLPAETLNYTYTQPGHLASMTSGIKYVREVDYNSIGLPTQIWHSSGLTYLYDHYWYADGTNRLTESKASTSDTTNNVAADRHYAYTDAGTITKINDTASAATDTQCFDYDYAQRLTNAWTPASSDCTADPTSASLGGPAPYWQTYSYDTVGDRTSITRHATATGGADVTDTYHYPAATADQPHAVTSIDEHSTDPTVADHTDTYSYDNDGNTTTRPGQTLTWDPQNRLTSTQVAGGTQTNIYDAQGNLTVQVNPDGSATAYLGDTELHTTADGKPTAIRTYTALGRTVAVRYSYPGFAYGRIDDQSTDPQGTAQVSFDTHSLKYTTRYFDPFGNPRDTTTVPWPDQRGFLNQPTNTTTDTTHLGARDYDSTLGRFLSVDPLLDVGDPQQTNGYNYADNNPISEFDPAGTAPQAGSPNGPECSGGHDCDTNASHRGCQRNCGRGNYKGAYSGGGDSGGGPVGVFTGDYFATAANASTFNVAFATVKKYFLSKGAWGKSVVDNLNCGGGCGANNFAVWHLFGKRLCQQPGITCDGQSSYWSKVLADPGDQGKSLVDQAISWAKAHPLIGALVVGAALGGLGALVKVTTGRASGGDGDSVSEGTSEPSSSDADQEEGSPVAPKNGVGPPAPAPGTVNDEESYEGSAAQILVRVAARTGGVEGYNQAVVGVPLPGGGSAGAEGALTPEGGNGVEAVLLIGAVVAKWRSWRSG